MTLRKNSIMNFDDNPQEAAYPRNSARTWIEANASPILALLAPEERRNWHDKPIRTVARGWQATKADAGYACISWPKERGGAGGHGD